MPYILIAAIVLLATTHPVMAQQRVVVVPAGVDIVIPPRGAEGPVLVRAPRPRIPGAGQPMTRPMLDASGGGSAGLGLAAPGLIALPLLAAAYLAGTVPGSSSSTSAPARTR